MLKFCFVYSHLPKFALNSAFPPFPYERERVCVYASRSPRPTPAGGSSVFGGFRAAATAVCFALRSANPRALWQAVTVAALLALASRWRFKHVNKAAASRGQRVCWFTFIRITVAVVFWINQNCLLKRPKHGRCAVLYVSGRCLSLPGRHKAQLS